LTELLCGRCRNEIFGTWRMWEFDRHGSTYG
jgi:hypothetical protein